MIIKLATGDKVKKQSDYYYETKNKEDGTVYKVHPSAFNSKELNVTTPDVTVTASRPKRYSSAFDSTIALEPISKTFELIGKGIQKVTDATGTTETASKIFPYLSPSQLGNWILTGNKPGSKENTGFGTSKIDQSLNLMFDLGTAPFIFKGINGGVKSVINKVPKRITNNTRFFKDSDLMYDYDSSSGTVNYYTPQQAKLIYLKTKRDAYNYFRSPEFQKRALNAGFTKDEIPKLLSEIEDHLKKTKFKGTDETVDGAYNRAVGFEDPITGEFDSSNFDIVTNPIHSDVQMRGNMWHELMHSIAGSGFEETSYPMLNKLKRFNDSTQPLTKSAYNDIDEDFFVSYRKAFDNYPTANPDKLANKALVEQHIKNVLDKEIVNKPQEYRSRLSTVLYRLRNLGYDTSKLVDNPNLFSQWITELGKKNTHMPWDLNQLLMPYDLKGLSQASGKLLTTSGGVYLGSKLYNKQ